MSKESFQIGWYVLKEDEIFSNRGFECAAWYENILVKAGKYPIMSSGFQWIDRDRCYTDQLSDRSIGCKLPGIIKGSDFTSHFGGNPIGSKIDKDIGRESNYYLNPYAHALAKWIIDGDENYELLPEFEAREIHFTYNEIPGKTYGIFKKNP